jgi:hypothetical protein
MFESGVSTEDISSARFEDSSDVEMFAEPTDDVATVLLCMA